MAELDLILTDGDRERLLRWTLAQEAVIVPDVHYKQPQLTRVSVAGNIGELLLQQHFFIVRQDWQVEDFALDHLENQYAGVGYRVRQRYGGPYIGYLLYPEHIDAGHIRLGRGSVYHYPFYYSSSDNRKIVPSPAFKKFFRELTQFIKTDAIHLKGRTRSAWLTRTAVEGITSGERSAPEEWVEAAHRALRIT